MPRYLLFCLLLSFGALSAQSDTIYGDLDKDGLPEMLVTVNHDTFVSDTSDLYDTLESAFVYRKIRGAWQRWEAASGYLMHAYEEAGMANFYPTIERGALVLTHSKPGVLNWDTTHRFRWQNGQFELIGFTHRFYDYCTGSESFDYNLSTGDYRIEYVDHSCNDAMEQGDFKTLIDYRGNYRPPAPYVLQDSDIWEVMVDKKGQELRGF